jgi:hypothetical protein
MAFEGTNFRKPFGTEGVKELRYLYIFNIFKVIIEHLKPGYG